MAQQQAQTRNALAPGEGRRGCRKRRRWCYRTYELGWDRNPKAMWIHDILGSRIWRKTKPLLIFSMQCCRHSTHALASSRLPRVPIGSNVTLMQQNLLHSGTLSCLVNFCGWNHANHCENCGSHTGCLFTKDHSTKFFFCGNKFVSKKATSSASIDVKEEPQCHCLLFDQDGHLTKETRAQKQKARKRWNQGRKLRKPTLWKWRKKNVAVASRGKWKRQVKEREKEEQEEMSFPVLLVRGRCATQMTGQQHSYPQHYECVWERHLMQWKKATSRPRNDSVGMAKMTLTLWMSEICRSHKMFLDPRPTFFSTSRTATTLIKILLPILTHQNTEIKGHK